MITVHPFDSQPSLLVLLLHGIKITADVHLRLVWQSYYKCSKSLRTTSLNNDYSK